MTAVNPQVAELVTALQEVAINGRKLTAELAEENGETYVRFNGGEFGSAQIAADSHITSVERVKAHWAGYCSANGTDLRQLKVRNLTERQLLWITEHNEHETRNGVAWEQAFKMGATYIEGSSADLTEMADFFERLDASNFLVAGPCDMTEAQYVLAERSLARSLDSVAHKVRRVL